MLTFNCSTSGLSLAQGDAIEFAVLIAGEDSILGIDAQRNPRSLLFAGNVVDQIDFEAG